MKMNHFIPLLNLQLFAEGGAAAAGAGDGGTAQGQGVTAGAASQQMKGAKSNPLADVKYGIQPEESAPAAEVQQTTEVQPDLNAEFEKLIKGQFKDQYNARMQDTIRSRLKGKDSQIEDLTKNQAAVTPILEILGKKYGVDATDIAALRKAISDDDSYFEQEAMERGMSVKDLKAIRKLEQDNAELKRKMQEQHAKENADKLYAQWLQQEQDIKKVYPAFDMQAEMQNKEFVSLLRANIDMKTAYEVLHKDEIIPAAMQYTAKTVEQKIAKKIASNGARPDENGMGSRSAAVVKSDVSQLSGKDIAEISRRVARGEKISFG